MSSDNAVGIMDGAYFTSRSEILEFINDLLDLNLTKIEQTASGAVACQITEYIFPGSVPMRRVNWETKNSYEYVANYKLLQAAFAKHRVSKWVDVDKLIRGKYQDNLEFCQWMKAFFDQQNVVRDDYDPLAARSKGKGGAKAREHLTGTSDAPRSRGAGGTSSRSAAAPARKGSRGGTAGGGKGGSSQQQTQPQQSTRERVARSNSSRTVSATQKENLDSNNSHNAAAAAAAAANESLLAENKELRSRLAASEAENKDLLSKHAELELLVTEIEKERDFYFGKLRSVELLLQTHDERKKAAGGQVAGRSYEALLGRVLKVLYATSEDDIGVDGDEGDVTQQTLDEVNDTLEESALRDDDHHHHDKTVNKNPLSLEVNYNDSIDEDAFLPDTPLLTSPILPTSPSKRIDEIDDDLVKNRRSIFEKSVNNAKSPRHSEASMY